MIRKSIVSTIAAVLFVAAPIIGIGADRVVLGEYFTQSG